ncbi:MAG TPA: AAA family ATPase [Candidatus Woesebacteria bacterium]|nr:AAA family ATPase [Candidatus Woesebacteria bacterium]HNS65519.1 AAA family ATPase [Candidatus Woesebacteria bacterium]
MQVSSEQKKAIEILLKWFADPRRKPFITLGGYAGTGKTTLIAELKNELFKLNKNCKFAFCSYTGRAAQNLKNRLKLENALGSKDTISTIHGLIYDPIENNQGVIVGWSRKEELEKDLIIVDEASMIDAPIWRDLLSYSIPILAVGDHGQLPPIQGEFNLMAKPDLVLHQIHRQAKDNPIIAVSALARAFGKIPVQSFGSGVVKYSRNDPEAQTLSGELLAKYTTDTLILCGFNATRVKINQFIRIELGFETPQPTVHDRVICLRNNQTKGIYNGMLGTILTIKKEEKDWYQAEIQMDDSPAPFEELIYAPQFGAQTAINFTKNRIQAARGDLFDFGYALTVHKAQGGQAKRVILFEERSQHMTDDMWRKWLYTAVTRAEEELFIFG